MLSVLAPLAPMTPTMDPGHRTPAAEHRESSPKTRTVPIITPTIQMAPSSPGDPMDTTHMTNPSAPNSTAGRSSDGEHNDGQHGQGAFREATNPPSSISMPAPAAAAAAVHQPKIVQTAFIHKLYNMLEDPSIQHLISWSSTQESFVMAPTNDFSKVLAQYFKHTNISSFVRQLNMYGFHKVSDVFHNGSPEQTLWEFKHGNGNFKRGDLVGLREIRRRASRHALVHREFNNQKPTPPQPGTPAEPMPPPPIEGGDPRTMHIEHALYDLTARLERSESNSQYMYIKQQAMMDTVARVLHFNQELTRTLLNMVPNPDDPIHRDVLVMQSDVQRQTELFRATDDPHDTPHSARTQYFSGIDNAPLSPRQMAQDDARRASLAVPPSRAVPFPYRPQVPSNLSLSARRPFGSISGGSINVTAQSSPSSLRPHMGPPPTGPHPLSAVEPPPGSLARRHTSADIREHGWQPAPPPPGHWPPSSPGRGAQDPEQHRLRESLSTYSLQSVSQTSQSRPMTPPAPPAIGGGLESMNSWSWGSADRSRKTLGLHDGSMPGTRRGSMAHILNPTDTAERDDEIDEEFVDDRKRKRLG